jgi:hypothetical protein
MNILDENSIARQRQRLRSWRIPVRQIGVDIARKGLQNSDMEPMVDKGSTMLVAGKALCPLWRPPA